MVGLDFKTVFDGGDAFTSQEEFPLSVEE